VLAEEEVCDHSTTCIASCEDIAISIVDVVGDEAGEECDEEVPNLWFC
jgi:hypothetical protein